MDRVYKVLVKANEKYVITTGFIVFENGRNFLVLPVDLEEIELLYIDKFR